MNLSELAQDVKYEEDWKIYRKLVMASLDTLQTRANEADERTRKLEVEIALLKQEQSRLLHQVAAAEAEIGVAKSGLSELRQEQKVFEAKSGVWGGAGGAIAAGVVMALKALGLLGG